MKRIGILAHSAEGAALSFLTACREGQSRLGAHRHPALVLDIECMGASMDDWERSDLAPIAHRFVEACDRLLAAGADFWICPDNTAHIALEHLDHLLPLPGLHIAEVVARSAADRGFMRVGVTGTSWTMAGSVYVAALARHGIEAVAPCSDDRETVQAIIFKELVLDLVHPRSREKLVAIIGRLAERGCDSVVLGCTELPLLLDDTTSPLPTLDSTRLQARTAVAVALGEEPVPAWRGGPFASEAPTTPSSPGETSS